VTDLLSLHGILVWACGAAKSIVAFFVVLHQGKHVGTYWTAAVRGRIVYGGHGKSVATFKCVEWESSGLHIPKSAVPSVKLGMPASLSGPTRSCSGPFRRPLEWVAGSLLLCGVRCEQSRDAVQSASPITLFSSSGTRRHADHLQDNRCSTYASHTASTALLSSKRASAGSNYPCSCCMQRSTCHSLHTSSMGVYGQLRIARQSRLCSTRPSS
jgi:hypothetical protein